MVHLISVATTIMAIAAVASQAAPVQQQNGTEIAGPGGQHNGTEHGFHHGGHHRGGHHYGQHRSEHSGKNASSHGHHGHGDRSPSSVPVPTPSSSSENDSSSSGSSSSSSLLAETQSASPSSSSTASASSSGASSSSSTSSQNDAALQLHNKYRAQHSADPLTWSSELAQYAQKWADGCVFEHSKGDYGENLAQGYDSVDSAITAWYDEYKDYDYSNPGFTEGTGHFTQVVWKGTKQLGCALSDCSGKPLYVCEYSPAGNIVSGNEFEENVSEN
ncbi:CAP domain-containing protein [Syncephalastrum racemosum]|uniref:CAP domain-containing protein n=1 Tax=Syncephalastrum racemosum TaxID=13706 RepID=A0A1X2HB17_SYNRA|nr:CAP domain-containing protein [Syncephalastrum racemosum]